MDGVCLEQQANIRIKMSQKVTLSPTLGNETACVCVCVWVDLVIVLKTLFTICRIPEFPT